MTLACLAGCGCTQRENRTPAWCDVRPLTTTLSPFGILAIQWRREEEGRTMGESTAAASPVRNREG